MQRDHYKNSHVGDAGWLIGRVLAINPTDLVWTSASHIVFHALLGVDHGVEPGVRPGHHQEKNAKKSTKFLYIFKDIDYVVVKQWNNNWTIINNGN